MSLESAELLRRLALASRLKLRYTQPMPSYEYSCAKCEETFQIMQSFMDEPLKRHKACGGKLSRVFGSVGVVLKGTGFYRTDNAPKQSSAE
jgi:putative FmdB family regulatory protein